jgi:NADH-quinone oxidoreductase subunit J
MTADIFLFYVLTILVVLASVGVVLAANPLISALHLVLSMLGIAGLFFLLGAPFVGAVQILVYAGAVMVLFVLVVMLVDVNTEEVKFVGGKVSALTKGLMAGVFSGLIAAMALKSNIRPKEIAGDVGFSMLEISKVLFTKYVVAFELLGLMLLVIPVGVVALSRIRGGTHER